MKRCSSCEDLVVTRAALIVRGRACGAVSVLSGVCLRLLEQWFELHSFLSQA